MGSYTKYSILLLRMEEASVTAQFCHMMDRFFDCLNVRNYASGIKSRKPFQMPYRSGDDERLKV